MTGKQAPSTSKLHLNTVKVLTFHHWALQCHTQAEQLLHFTFTVQID